MPSSSFGGGFGSSLFSTPFSIQTQQQQQQQTPLFQQPSTGFGFQTPFATPQTSSFPNAQLTTQMAPVAPLPFSLADRDIQAIVDAYKEDLENPKYAFKYLLFSVIDPQYRVKPAGVSDEFLTMLWRGMQAIELTEELAHELLENNKDLHFDLLSLHFVELVCSRKCSEALEFAQTKLTPFGKVQKYVEKLEDFMALLAYEEPEKSPMFHLLSLEYRQQVADSLNRAILGHANRPSYTAMERLIQQATVVRQYLNQDHVKDGLSPFSLKDFLKG